MQSDSDDILISVCIPVFNMEGTILRTLQSCLNQGFHPNVEYILLDNCSTDETFNISHSKFSGLKNFRIIRNATNLGAYGNHNEIVRLAKGKWIKFLHGDDQLLNGCVDELLDMIKSDQSLYFFDFTGNEYYESCNRKVILLGQELADLIIWYGSFIGTPTTTLIKRSAIVECGYYDLNLNPASDIDLCFRIAKKHGGCFVNKKLVVLDDDPFDNYSSLEKNKLMFFRNAYKQIDKWKELDSHLSSADWKDIEVRELNRFLDSALILLSRKRPYLMYSIINETFKRKILFKGLLKYLHSTISKRILNIKNEQYWYLNI